MFARIFVTVEKTANTRTATLEIIVKCAFSRDMAFIISLIEVFRLQIIEMMRKMWRLVRDDHSLIGYSACGHTLLVTIPSQIRNTPRRVYTLHDQANVEID